MHTIVGVGASMGASSLKPRSVGGRIARSGWFIKGGSCEFDGSEGSQPEDLAVGRICRRMGNLIHSIAFLSTRRQTLTIEVDKNLCDIYRKYYPRSCGKLQCIVYNVWLRDHNSPEFPPLVSPFTWVLVPQPRNGKSSHLI